MRGFLVLHLVGEQIAREMIGEGVESLAAESWLEDWTRVVEDARNAHPGNLSLSSGFLSYRIRRAHALMHAAGASDHEQDS